jgi:hypothetical protein
MFDVYEIRKEALVVCRPKGILDLELASKIVEFIEVKEQHVETGFNRFVDLTGLDRIYLSTADVLQLAARRRNYNPNEVFVKSALLATDPLTAAVARMYEQLLASPRIEIRVFGGIQAAADWLGVNRERLVL